MREAFGLDQPIAVQYLIYLKNLVTLEWGRSFTSSEKVFDILVYRFWNTMLLMVAGLMITFSIGISLGMVMGWRRGGKLDIGATVGALIMQSAPPFITGILLLIVLSYRLDLFPTGGMHSPGNRPDSLLGLIFTADFLHHIVLPTITVTAYYLATPMLIMRDSMLEVLGSDYVEFARAKGLPPHKVMIRHAAGTPCSPSSPFPRSCSASRSEDRSSSKPCSPGRAWASRWSRRHRATTIRSPRPRSSCSP